MTCKDPALQTSIANQHVQLAILNRICFQEQELENYDPPKFVSSNLRGQHVQNTSDPSNSRQPPFDQEDLLSPELDDSRGAVIANQHVRSAAPALARSYIPLPQDRSTFAQTQDSRSPARSHSNGQRGTERQQTNDNLPQGFDNIAPLEIGADGKPKGLVRYIRGIMEHREAREITWRPAVYHEDLRDKLIAEGSLLGAYGNFSLISSSCLSSADILRPP